MGRPRNKDLRIKYGNSIKEITVTAIKQIAFNEKLNENEVIENAISFYGKILKIKKAAEKQGKTLEGLLDEAISMALLKLSKEKLG